MEGTTSPPAIQHWSGLIATHPSTRILSFACFDRLLLALPGDD